MLTALDTEANGVQGLEAGADDYVTKPFGLAELRSRDPRRAAAGRHRSIGGEILVVGPIALDRAAARGDGRRRAGAAHVQRVRAARALMTEPGRLLNRQELLRAIWGDSAYRDPRAIDVHIRHLREKLEPEPEKPKYILTVRGPATGCEARSAGPPVSDRGRVPDAHAAAVERLRAARPDRRNGPRDDGGDPARGRRGLLPRLESSLRNASKATLDH